MERKARTARSDTGHAVNHVHNRQQNYAASWPSTRFRFGMYDLVADEGPNLVGVIALGVPMSNQVLTRPFPGLLPSLHRSVGLTHSYRSWR
jgi:hypothetical protein